MAAPRPRLYVVVYPSFGGASVTVRTLRGDDSQRRRRSQLKTPTDRRSEMAQTQSSTGMRFPGESAEYRAARDRLLDQEIELRRAMEAVAVARRRLPPGGVVPEDYVFQGALADGTEADIRLSELFAPGRDSLVIYSFM